MKNSLISGRSLLLYQFTRRAIKLTVVIIVGYHCYQLHTKYCDVLAGNASSNLWILDFMLDLLDISSGGITLNYYSLNLTINTLR
jgi:hypothetical protein